jgi:hypothetical protein
MVLATSISWQQCADTAHKQHYQGTKHAAHRRLTPAEKLCDADLLLVGSPHNRDCPVWHNTPLPSDLLCIADTDPTETCSAQQTQALDAAHAMQQCAHAQTSKPVSTSPQASTLLPLTM